MIKHPALDQLFLDFGLSTRCIVDYNSFLDCLTIAIFGVKEHWNFCSVWSIQYNQSPYGYGSGCVLIRDFEWREPADNQWNLEFPRYDELEHWAVTVAVYDLFLQLFRLKLDTSEKIIAYLGSLQ